ncbi:MAG: hypothetical protein LQ342_006646 [Letrouitia transgressa]|nr:MAG: hypothetical protein LQ342_006646 [Letrouitia transgressa]
MYGLFVLELVIEIAALALFGIAQPDLYRTRLWQEGADHGWNSNPNEIIYAYANYRPIHTPLPWSQFVTNFNVIISVVALFVLLVKGIMFITKVFHPLLSVVIHAALIALFAISAHAQAGSDMSDPEHPQPGPPCVVFLAYLIISLYSLIPNKEFRASRSSKLADSESGAYQRPWEMTQVPQTPGTTGGMKSPTTPRTTAFDTLSGKIKGKDKLKGKEKAPAVRTNGELPLRHHISMGDETYQSPTSPNGK